MMIVYGALETATMVWHEPAVDDDLDVHYELAKLIPVLFDTLSKYQVRILLRQELMYEIQGNLPFTGTLPVFAFFRNFLYKFFAQMADNFEVYDGPSLQKISSDPEVRLHYYVPTLRSEVELLISEIHRRGNDKTFYFTLERFWNKADSKLLIRDSSNVEIANQAIFSESQQTLEAFLESQRRKFIEFKHRGRKAYRGKKGRTVSTLSCQDGKTNKKCQELLDKACQSGIRLYNYDVDNKVWVVFMADGQNEFHGYDETDESKIPTDIKDKFSYCKA